MGGDLAAEALDFSAGAAFEEQWHEVANWPIIEARMVAMYDRGDGVRRDRGIAFL